jgi:hypothetical protein
VEIAEHATVETVPQPGEPRPVRWFALAICAAALASGVVLVARGAARPAPGPVLLLAVVAALCVNRFALFPTEHASTAEAAVLLAAVVGFRADAVYLGPLLVGLLVGPLDALHWEQRSFVRMAYNAGNRGLAALAASAAFVGCRDALGSSTASWCVVVVVAGAAFVAVDLVLSTTLLRLSGDPVRIALRHLLEVDALTLPIAWYGGAVALLLGPFGWWAAVLALVPVAFVPELVIARGRRRTATVRDVAALLAVVAVLTTLAMVVPVPDATVVVALVAVGLLTGAELVVDSRTVLPPLAALLVVAATVVVGRDEAAFAAVLVTVSAVGMSWWCAGRASRPALLVVVPLAIGTALLAAALATATPRTLTGIVVGAGTAALAFEVVAVLTCASPRRLGAQALWTAPLVAAAFGWAELWRTIGIGGALVFGAAVAVSLAVAANWGAPAWRSRVIAPAARAGGGGGLGVLLVVAAIASMGTAVLAAVAHGHVLGTASVWVTAGVGESAVAMVSMGVRQWRLAPRARTRSLVVLLVVSALFVAVVPRLLLHGSLVGPAVVLLLFLALAALARQPLSRARAVRHEAARVSTP